MISDTDVPYEADAIQQQTPRSFKSQKLLILIAAVLLIALVAGIGWYLLGMRNNQTAPLSQPSPSPHTTLNTPPSPTTILSSTPVLSISPVSATEAVSWKTYKNGPYGYSIQYPSNWSSVEARVDQSGEGGYARDFLLAGELQKVYFSHSPRFEEEGVFEISVSDNSNNLSLQQIAQQLKAKNRLLDNGANIQAIGRDAIIFHHDCCQYPEDAIIIILNNGYIYRVSYTDILPDDKENQGLLRILQQMLASMEFTN